MRALRRASRDFLRIARRRMSDAGISRIAATRARTSSSVMPDETGTSTSLRRSVIGTLDSWGSGRGTARSEFGPLGYHIVERMDTEGHELDGQGRANFM